MKGSPVLAKLPLLVDAHTHLFNARYLPLKGILESWHFGSLPSALIAKLVYTLTRRSKLKSKDQYIDVSDANKPLEKLVSEITDITIEALLIDVDLPETSLTVEQIEEIQDIIINDEVHSILLEINQEYGNPASTQELSFDYLMQKQSKQQLMSEPFESNLISLFGKVKAMLKKFLLSVLSKIEHGLDYVDFILNMMKSEKSLLKRLRGFYTKQTEMSLMVHYMMDMEHPFKNKPPYHFYKHQIPRMTSLERYGKGTAVGFAAFDISRFSKMEFERSQLKDVIENHLSYMLQQGKIGFKFYPPMGYRASDNTDIIDEYCADVFFDYCVDNQVPVFTHCTPVGFEAGPNMGLNADPIYWRKALTKTPKRNDLILCLGHAGGGIRRTGGITSYGWLAANQNQWDSPSNYAKKVVDLCREFKNVYCDLSYMHEITDDDKLREVLKSRLITELTSQSESQPYLLAEKIMYGSDWHMVSMVNDLTRYFQNIRWIFQDEKLKPFTNKFFAKNALKYMQFATFTERAKEQLNESCYNRYMEILVRADSLA